MHKRKVAELLADLSDQDEEAVVQSRFTNGFRPRKMCSFFLEGRCQKGEACTYAHALEELHPEAAQQLEAETADSAAQAMGADSDVATAPTEEALAAAGMYPSVLQGPREFPPDLAPRQLCPFWMHHPACCEQGDECHMAHGLAELGLEFGDPVEIRTDGGAASNAGAAPTLTPEQYRSATGSGSIESGLNGRTKGTGWKGARLALPMSEDCARGKGCMCGPRTAGAGSGMMPNRFAGSGFMPMKICNFWLKDPSACTKGIHCSFAHGVHELQPSAVATCGVSRFHHTGRLPTKYCTFYANGQCIRGLSCTFAHSPEELHGGGA